MAAAMKEGVALEEMFLQLKNEFVMKKKLDPKTVRAHFLARVKEGPQRKIDMLERYKLSLFFLLPVALAILLGAILLGDTLLEISEGRHYCALETNQFLMEMVRPIFNCELCRNMTRIERIPKISRQEFLEKYAYTTIPVVITGATDGWKALDTFSYRYFKKLYTHHRGGMESVDKDCQFFNWGYPFESMQHVFNMTDAQADLEPGEESWYVGWSNCHGDTAKVLREHYETPYFLPEKSETSTLDWIFIGWPGPGAFMHIDKVGRPSWQAQISGRKKWKFVPVPECAGICKDEYEVIVEKGDIMILDSNQWYHSTFVMPGEISITIGSEYD